ncbi:MAG: 2-amino-4-hydroxy-6-hydroxymethyldihydropteridine diphosphokinase [Lentisphaeria bacterium]|nr:2-amino-4-hydroxy-6-hydroxymethyldihydropteridine diphosphokinase [Lentisphaeria bacterium]
MPDHPESAPLCVLALGGNLGDSAAFFRRAVESLQSGGFRVRKVSTFIRTEPEGMAPGTPAFLNGAVSGVWDGTAAALLRLCQKIEAENGRPADHEHYVSRTLDLDIILFGQQSIREPGLTIPHPLALRRAFVMTPLREIEPEMAEWLEKDHSVSTGK